MGGIRYVQGDATHPIGDGPRVIAHVCNDAGGWGKGFVLAVSKRWPQPEQKYRDSFSRYSSAPRPVLGDIQVVEVAGDLWVANMIAQHGYTTPGGQPAIRYLSLEKCLEAVARFAMNGRSASVHMPRIGCGLAGGRWDRVEPIIERTLCAKGIPVTVYDFGG